MGYYVAYLDCGVILETMDFKVLFNAVLDESRYWLKYFADGTPVCLARIYDGTNDLHGDDVTYYIAVSEHGYTIERESDNKLFEYNRKGC